jgi:DNA helicase-2/ATP-dependent DNA helicase PcrA
MMHAPDCRADYPEKPKGEPPQFIITIPLDDGTVMNVCSDCGSAECEVNHLTAPSVSKILASLSNGTGVPIMSAVQQAVRVATNNWSAYQEDLFQWAAHGVGNIMVVAVAGSGKSTTGVEMVKRMRGSHIYLAFNRPIADELVNKGVNGRTFHSLCYGPTLRFLGLQRDDVKGNKLRILIDEHFMDRPTVAKVYGTFMTKLVGLARNAGIGAGLLEDVASEWEALVEHHNLEPDGDKGTVEEGIQLAQELLAVSNDCRTMVDYDDMLYLVVKEGISLPKFDNVLVDEAQDTNAIQRAIIRKIMHARTRLAAVGDPAQAIYGFRGADSDSMDLLKSEFNCVSMPLTVTYRCPNTVVEYARQWVDHIEAAPGAIDGAVNDLTTWNNKVFGPCDLVVCRTTKPLVALAYRLIRDRIPAIVKGREIGQGLVKLIQRMNARGVDALIEKLQAHTNREVAKAMAAKLESKAEGIRDKTDCILCIAEGLYETDRTVPALIAAIEQLFSDATTVGVTLATIHKAKGLEADRVFWLNRSKCPSPWARQDWQMQQEDNLCYVAATRAKRELFLIEEQERV